MHGTAATKAANAGEDFLGTRIPTQGSLFTVSGDFRHTDKQWHNTNVGKSVSHVQPTGYYSGALLMTKSYNSPADHSSERSAKAGALATSQVGSQGSERGHIFGVQEHVGMRLYNHCVHAKNIPIPTYSQFAFPSYFQALLLLSHFSRVRLCGTP
ncbi:hypothetical protein MG293_000229 [Ovis ammon polii]|uniref:Uncharacterized protein n=1 Tax=Ovis ammon polii TaxID=230172 RepID=A0AAD4YGZ3_OVIAM|nr:hypothetical protein MG293_000229 [Ovis ammon polii]